MDSIQAPLVWDFTTGSSYVRVGVIDSGIASHLDLNENYEDDDAWDFYDVNSEEPDLEKGDLKSHGTHVAGIIGAVGDNEIGVSGINWDVSLVQLRTTHAPNYLAATINAIRYTNELSNQEQKIYILNLSVGIREDSRHLEEAIRSFCNNGGLFICSTGNSPQDNDETNHYPSFYASQLYGNPIPNMITVGRIDINNERPDGANWGLNTIMLYAPGEHILSTIPAHICLNNNSLVITELGDRYACECERQFDQWVQVTEHQDNGYHYVSGSSMSTPHVSGVAALLLSVNPNLTAAQIKKCIMNGADDIIITIGDSTTQSVKSLNAWGAFKYLMDNYPVFERNVGYNDVTYTYNIDADASYMIDHTAMMKFNVRESGEYTMTVTADEPIEVKLYNSELQEIDVVQAVTNESKEIGIVCTLSKDVYYLRVNYLDHTDEGNVSVYIDCSHIHSYEFWVYVNDTTHRSECGCGERGNTIAPHGFIPLIDSFNNVVCSGCGYTKNLGSGNGNIILTNPKVSLNGSYILPDGNIVLVDEDVEAYLNGTLVFYDKDKLPVMQ